VAIIYRTAGAWGAGNGANLTPAQVDGNFWDLHGRVGTLENTPPTPNNIANITATGSQMTITMDDASTFGPFTLPTARLVWTGDWADATAYGINNTFRDPDTGSIYIVIKAHTSVAPFDAAATSGGDPVYELMIDAAEIASGGGGIAGVVETSSTTINPSIDQANYLFLTDYFDSATYNANSGFVTCVLPDDAAVAFPVGTRLYFGQLGNTLEITVTDATVYAPTNPILSRYYGSILTATKVAVDTWFVSGDLNYGESRSGYLNDVITVSGTTYTPTHDNRNQYFRCTNAAGCAFTVPGNATVAYRVGTTLEIRQSHATCVVTLTAGSGVTFNLPTGATGVTAALGDVIMVRKVATNNWDVYGDVS
jgi:hypothetical protein